jgi:hypothetical protein
VRFDHALDPQSVRLGVGDVLRGFDDVERMLMTLV